MFRRLTPTLDMAIGAFLASAGAAFGLVGWLTGLANNRFSTTWFTAALILGIAAAAVMLDELRARDEATGRRFDALLGTLLALGGLGLGTVGFILGLMSRAHAMTWLVGGIVLAILSLTAMLDELRLHHAVDSASASVSGIGWLFAALGLGLGVVGFVLGLMSRAYSDTWYWAAVISSVVSVAWMFEAEHRDVLLAHGSPLSRPL